MAKGKLKTGGRKAGTPNKKTQALIEKATAKGIDLFDAALELAIAADGNDKFNMIMRLCEYVYPKRKAIEHSGEISAKKVIKITGPSGNGVLLTEGDNEAESDE